MVIFGDLTDAFIDQAISLALADPDNVNETAGLLSLRYPNLDLSTIQGALPVNISTGSVSCGAQFVADNVSTTFEDLISLIYGDGRVCLDDDGFTDIIVVQCLIYSGIALGVVLLSYFQVWCFQMAAAKQVHQIRLHFYRAILHQDIGWFDANPGGELSSRLSE